MPKEILCPDSLNFQPRPTYPYSPGTKAGRLVLTAGQVAWNDVGDLVGIGDVRAQTIQTLKNVLSVLEEGGAQHCQRDNLSIGTTYMFDWLKEKLGA